MAATLPAAAAACRAFSSAFSRKVAPDSSGDVAPSSPSPRKSKGRFASKARNSRSLPGLLVATMSGLRSTGNELRCVQARNAGGRKIQQLIEFVAAKRVTLGSTLHLDEAAAAVHDHVHVGLRIRVLGIVQ